MQRDLRAVVIGSGYAGTKHVEALREIGLLVEGPLSARRAPKISRSSRDRTRTSYT